MKDELDGADSFEAEGIQAFTDMTATMKRLGGRLDGFEKGLASKVSSAEQAAAKAESAAQKASQVVKHAEATARASARHLIAWAILVSLAGVLVIGGAAYWLGHDSGRESGLADGYATARDEQAAASWANTPSGRLAFALDRAGSLSMLAQCSNQGWKAETISNRRVCIVRPIQDGIVYGWTLP